MTKIKPFYPKGYITKIINKIPTSRRVAIKGCIRAGCGIDYLIERYDLPKKHATALYIEYKPKEPSAPAQIGSKTEPYYKKEINELPVYKLEDLTGEEKYISKQNITPTKLWTWEE
jgi:hypothetical protein